jgi:hypothetical protein
MFKYVNWEQEWFSINKYCCPVHKNVTDSINVTVRQRPITVVSMNSPRGKD